MKTNLYMAMFAPLFISGHVTASEPVKCYKRALPLFENEGLDVMSPFMATDFCSGATDANKLIQCYVEARSHPDDGGLGLDFYLAIELCKTVPSGED